MARRHSRKHHRRHRRGGAPQQISMPNPSSYSSAATFQMANLGTQDAQYNRVFSQSSPFPPNGNGEISAYGMRVGGSRRRHRRHRRTHRRRRGGFMGTLSRAAVPLALIGAQHYYSRRHNRHH